MGTNCWQEIAPKVKWFRSAKKSALWILEMIAKTNDSGDHLRKGDEGFGKYLWTNVGAGSTLERPISSKTTEQRVHNWRMNWPPYILSAAQTNFQNVFFFAFQIFKKKWKHAQERCKRTKSVRKRTKVRVRATCEMWQKRVICPDQQPKMKKKRPLVEPNGK